MAGHYLRKRLRSAPFARRLACFAGLVLLATLLVFRLGGIDFRALEALLLIAAAMGLMALVLAVIGLQRVWSRGYEGGGAALGALFVGLLVAVPFAFAGALAVDNPPTNTAETDGLAEADGVATTATVVDGRVFPVRASQMYQTVRLVIGDLGWSVSDVETADPEPPGDAFGTPVDPLSLPPLDIVPVPTPRVAPDGAGDDEAGSVDPLDRPESSEYRILAVARVPVIGLPSDVEIRITEDENQAYLDLRSVSRFGTHDLGQNRRFIESFLARIDAAMIGVGATPTG